MGITRGGGGSTMMGPPVEGSTIKGDILLRLRSLERTVVLDLDLIDAAGPLLGRLLLSLRLLKLIALLLAYVDGSPVTVLIPPTVVALSPEVQITGPPCRAAYMR